MIKTIEMLREELAAYRNPDAKVKRMVNEGLLIAVTRGLYETDSSVPGYCLAGSIYGPSYLSFEYALSYHGLIPETVHHFTSATFEKKKVKRYETPMGGFIYRDVPSSAYPLEVSLMIEKGYAYQIATAEKAVCDMLYKISPLKNAKGLNACLFDDLRIDVETFYQLDMNKMLKLCEFYRTQNHRLLARLIKKEAKHG